MKQIYVSDTNIWIDFRNANLLDALFQLPFQLCCTDFVLNELVDFQHGELFARGLIVEALDGDALVRLFAMMAAHNNSALADVSCYLLAQDTGRPLLTGDGRLRKQALNDGLQVFGALWLLDMLVEHAVIPASVAADGLNLMLAKGARLPKGDCQERFESWMG